MYVIHAADGNIPSDMSTDSPEQIEEERRLFYIALTRAKDWLYVTVPQRYYFGGPVRGDAHSYGQPTRFLTSEARKCFHETAASMHDPDDEAGDLPVSTERVRAAIRRAW